MGDHQPPVVWLELERLPAVVDTPSGKLAVVAVAGRSSVADKPVVAGRRVAPPAGLVGRRCSMLGRRCTIVR